VSRGGDKLAAALRQFLVDVKGARALDAGASTGGFTDCLLQRGAARVIAVDVGHGQLDARLRADDRVWVLERTNVRDLDVEQLVSAHHGDGIPIRPLASIDGAPVPESEEPSVREVSPAWKGSASRVESSAAEGSWAPVDVVTADLSFISLTKVISVLLGPVLRAGGEAILLVKPQFEAGRIEVTRGRGVVTDPSTWLATLSAVACAVADTGAAIIGAMASPLTGPSGNREFFLHARTGAGTGSSRNARAKCTTEEMVLQAIRSVAPTFEPTAGARPARIEQGE
jgi:23S rRNA (cytidine1920-2'-O)/16S rRNA (cytidine1409-2'-O)-methyltransferase